MSFDSDINTSLLDDVDFNNESFFKFFIDQYIKPNIRIMFPDSFLNYIKQVSELFELMIFDEIPQKYKQMQHYEKLVSHLTRS